jgi:hypothetical protein
LKAYVTNLAKWESVLMKVIHWMLLMCRTYCHPDQNWSICRRVSVISYFQNLLLYLPFALMSVHTDNVGLTPCVHHISDVSGPVACVYNWWFLSYM